MAKHLLKTAGIYVPVGAFTNVKFLNKLPGGLRMVVMEESRKLTDRPRWATRSWPQPKIKPMFDLIKAAAIEIREAAHEKMKMMK